MSTTQTGSERCLSRAVHRHAVPFSTALAALLASGLAFAYTPTTNMLPTDLRVSVVLSEEPIHNNWTRYVTFVNLAGDERSVAVAFSKASDLHYEGSVTADGLAVLQGLVDPNNRSYWDDMYFENKGGNTDLEIASISAEIEYTNTCCGREPTAQIAYNLNKSLAAGNSKFHLSAYTGRRIHALNYFGWSSGQFSALPEALKYFIYDAGKSGSSDSLDSVSSSNPKYADSGTSLCSETVSWYYYTYGVRIVDALFPWVVYDFKDVTSHAQMHDYFKNADRLYCYHATREQWVKKDRTYQWVYGDTYTPQPGDYLDRRASNPGSGDDGHAMMLIRWSDDTGIADTIDGPYNINFRPVNVKSLEQSGTRDFCVGRIPFND